MRQWHKRRRTRTYHQEIDTDMHQLGQQGCQFWILLLWLLEHAYCDATTVQPWEDKSDPCVTMMPLTLTMKSMKEWFQQAV